MLTDRLIPVFDRALRAATGAAVNAKVSQIPGGALESQSASDPVLSPVERALRASMMCDAFYASGCAVGNASEEHEPSI